jgi:hypothetical protein
MFEAYLMQKTFRKLPFKINFKISANGLGSNANQQDNCLHIPNEVQVRESWGFHDGDNESTVLWDVTPCILVHGYGRFGGSCWRHF